jgi:chemotaxis protein methyltransferase CheR
MVCGGARRRKPPHPLLSTRGRTMNHAVHFELKDRDFRRISELAYSVCRINLHQGKKELVRSRLAKRMRALRIASFGEYIERVESDGGELTRMIDALSTNLTTFFREPRHFDFLVENMFPAMKDNPAARCRFWCAGCSSGEEPYSLAMLLNEHLDGAGGRDIKILATDISTRMLDIARSGAYPETRFQNMDPMLKSKYFDRADDRGEPVRVAGPLLRQLIKFRYLNLMEPWPMKRNFDVIFCRNVMIYFDKPTQEALVRRFHEKLNPGGYLFIGHSESLIGVKHDFEFVQSSVYRRGGRAQ